MKFWIPARHPQSIGKVSAGWLMLVIWLGAFALSASPEFHHFVHEDAQNSAHACLITQIQAGIESGFAPVVAPARVLTPLVTVKTVEVSFVPAGDPSLSPSRGPPPVSFISVA